MDDGATKLAAMPDRLLQELGIVDFSPLLAAYREAGIDLGSAIDGGAGAGFTATKMLKHLRPDAQVFAYEPFPGNHRFFEGIDPRIVLRTAALSDHAGIMTLSVPAVVAPGAAWRDGTMTGYSSGGRLVAKPPSREHDVEVKCVTADKDIPPNSMVGFIKLDLQGGEAAALRGMKKILRSAHLLWVEMLFSDKIQMGELYSALASNDFLIFDTEYLLKGVPTKDAQRLFRKRKEFSLSSGAPAWLGYKLDPWGNFIEEAHLLSQAIGLTQTDLCCVNRRHLADFLRALQFIDAS